MSYIKDFIMCIIEDYENDLTIEDIAFTYDISEKQVIQILKDCGKYLHFKEE